MTNQIQLHIWRFALVTFRPHQHFMKLNVLSEQPSHGRLTPLFWSRGDAADTSAGIMQPVDELDHWPDWPVMAGQGLVVVPVPAQVVPPPRVRQRVVQVSDDYHADSFLSKSAALASLILVSCGRPEATSSMSAIALASRGSRKVLTQGQAASTVIFMA
jgi:hypothetical protein